MDLLVDVNQLSIISREHSDNKHILRQENFKVGLISVRPHGSLPIHSHPVEEQFYYILEGEGFVQLGDIQYPLRPGFAVSIPPGLEHGVINPNDQPLVYLDIFINWKH